MSYDQTPPPPAGPPPPGYAPTPAAPQPSPKSGTNGWVIAFTVVLVLALGGLAAAIISKGDSGKTTATTPIVTVNPTTVQNTTTVTTATEPANITVAPNVTLNSSGAPEPVQTGAQTSTAGKTTSTP